MRLTKSIQSSRVPHCIDILPRGFHRNRRQWHAEGVALLRFAARVSVPGWIEPCIRVAQRERLLSLLEWIDARMAAPIAVVEKQDLRDVVVFGTIVYRCDSARHSVAGWAQIGGKMKPLPRSVELRNPLCTSWWLRPLIAKLGFAESRPQSDLFVSNEERERMDSWLVDTAYRLLTRDPRFGLIRKEIRRTLNLDADLVRISLAARYSARGSIDSELYSLIWRHADAMRQIARLSPQLLPWARAYLESEKIALQPYPLGALREHFLSGTEEGKMEWRYLVRHGARIFRIPWEVSGCSHNRLWNAGRYFSVLAAAGLPPPPPPPSVLRALLRMYGEQIWFEGWCDVPYQVLGTALREADRLRAQPELSSFVDDFISVCYWAAENDDKLTYGQRKAEWRSLLRHAREWERKRLLLAQKAGLSWECLIEDGRFAAFYLKALNSGEAMVEEGFAMRHCAANYVQRCADGEMRFFSLREQKSEKRVATLSLVRDKESDQWRIFEIKGFANRPVNSPLQSIGTEIARSYTLAQRSALA